MDFWETESDNLTKQFKEKIFPLIERSEVKHFSLFCLGTIPLLIKLGTLFGDVVSVDSYQLFKEPKGWCWEDKFPDGFEFIIEEPKSVGNKPILIISVSAIIDDKRVKEVMGERISIWKLTVPPKHIGDDNIRNRAQLPFFRIAVREIMGRIKVAHGPKTPLSIFPAMSVSCATEMGRVRLAKSDMPWIIFDQNNKKKGFTEAIKIKEI